MHLFRFTRKKKFSPQVIRDPRGAINERNTIEETLHASRWERDKLTAELKTHVEALHQKNLILEQFGYTLTHDLREPLRTIATHLRILFDSEKTPTEDESRLYVRYILESSERMQILIEDMLKYSLTGNNVHFRVIDMNQVVQDVLRDLGAMIRESGAQILTRDLPQTSADRFQVRNLFQHLLTNALKFRCPDRPLRVTLSSDKVMGQWTFSVQDNGLGFDPKDANHIFDLFRTLQPNEKVHGSGIGLAICKKIVERHGGRIWAESKPGFGTKLSFTLPARGMGEHPTRRLSVA